MLTKVKIYGHLKEITGCSSFEIKANDTADAVVFLISNFPVSYTHLTLPTIE